MNEYAELIKELREWPRACAEYDGSVDQLHDRAADAIEKLVLKLDKANNYEVNTNNWIPVTELPPEGETYGDTTFSVEVLGTEGFTYRKAYYNFRYKVWLDGNEEQEWPSITHWMPLPEPPREET